MKTYQKLCTEFYDLEPHRDGAVSHIFYLQRAREAAGRVLEPMCGTGRFLIPMLQAGIEIEGFDASPYMLAALRQKWAAISSTPPQVWGEWVQNFSSSNRYNLIFVPYGSWGLITDIEVAKRSLATLYSHLRPGGKLIFEIETIASVPEPQGVWRRGIHRRADGSGIAVNTYAIYESASQLFKSICRYESIRQGIIEEVETEDFWMYLYGFDEMDKYLEQIGFTITHKYQDYKLTPATDRQAHILIYECER